MAKPKHLLVFGAGASKGSDSSGTPPLGSELFGELGRFDPNGWGSIGAQRAQLFRGDFEHGMREILEGNSQGVAALQRRMAAFFFKFRPGSSNLYMRLAEKIRERHWEGAVATLNYERLLELSLLSQGLKPVCGKEASGESEIEVCLPHGCCHLFCTSVSMSSRGVTISVPHVEIGGRVEPIVDPQKFRERIDGDAVPPAMSYFVPSKVTTCGPKFIKGQQGRFAGLVEAASTIGIVGLQVREYDGHIWKPLAQAPGRLVCCSGESSGRTFREWANSRRPHKIDVDVVLPHSFYDGFEELCSSVGLS